LFVDTYLCIDGDVNGDRVSTSDESETDWTAVSFILIFVNGVH
jgi:hypothetical protein